MQKFLQVAVLILSLNIIALSQTEPDLPASLGTALGVFKINSSKKFVGFEDFDYFWLDKFPNQDTDDPTKDKQNRVFITGELGLSDKTFKFKIAYIKRVKIGEYEYFEDVYFKTKIKKNISYEFRGKFLRDYLSENGGFTTLFGELTKYKNGKKIAGAKIPFFELAQL